MSLTLTTFLKISADGKGARAEVRLTADELRKMGATNLEAAKAMRSYAAELNRHAREAIAAEGAARGAAAGFDTQGKAARGAANANAMAAGSVGNLTAQFNDIGMMLAAGQNPLMLALQQGTQITQVFGTAGAGQAVRMLGSAFLSLLSPLNLITLGVIGFGAAAIQWLMDTGEEAMTLGDAIGDLRDKVDAYRDAAEAARAPTGELTKEYGAQAAAVRELLKEKEELARRDAESAVRQTVDRVRTTISPDEFFGGGDLAFDIEKFFGLNRDVVGGGSEEIREIVAALEEVENANGIEKQTAALERLYAAMQEAAWLDDSINDAENAALSEINALLIEQARLRAEAAGPGAAGQVVDLQQLIDLQREKAALEAEDAVRAQAMLADLTTEAQINQLIAQYGRDSAIVSAARANAEREVFAAMVDSMNIAQAMKDELLRAYDAANAIARANIAAMLSAAVGQASRLASQLWDAARASSSIGGLAGMAERAAGAAGSWIKRTWTNMVDMSTKGTGTGGVGAGTGAGAGGGASAAREEANAVAELIERQERELELLRETDPVKKEMLRYREQLANATEAERAKVEELIATRIREDQQIKARSDLLAYANDMTLQFLNTVIVQGKSARGILVSLVNELLRAFVTGKGVFAQVFGLQGGIWNALFPKKAGGGAVALADGGDPAGMVRGPGTARSDSILAWLSNGEFVVNAKATARHRQLLEDINSGSTPRLANGGPVGGRPGTGGASRMRGGERPVFNIHVHGATGNAEVRSMVRDGVAAGLRVYDSDALPGAVLSVLDDPKVLRR